MCIPVQGEMDMHPRIKQLYNVLSLEFQFDTKWFSDWRFDNMVIHNECFIRYENSKQLRGE